MPRRSAIKITKTKIDELPVGRTIWDSEIPGFGITANAHSKTYKLKYYFQTRQRMLTIGTHGTLTVDQARKLAISFRAEINGGTDPAAKKQATGMTVAELCVEYMARHANVMKKEGSASADAANIRNHVIPLLGKLTVLEVSSVHIEKFKGDVQSGKTAPKDPQAARKLNRGASVVAGGKGAANRCLALLSKMFNLAESWGHRAQRTNPVYGVEKFKENSKNRFLSDAEFKALWSHLTELEASPDEGLRFAVAMIRLLILTGARSGEIKTLKWSMVDLKGSRLNLPDSKTGAKTIQLSKMAVAELEKLPRISGNPYVIAGAKDQHHLVNIRKPWVAIRKKVGLEDVRLHDLRHSFASMAAAQGLDLLTIGKLMGHKNMGTTQRYTHLAEGHVSKANQVVTDAFERAFGSVSQESLATPGDDELEENVSGNV